MLRHALPQTRTLQCMNHTQRHCRPSGLRCAPCQPSACRATRRPHVPSSIRRDSRSLQCRSSQADAAGRNDKPASSGAAAAAAAAPAGVADIDEGEEAYEEGEEEWAEGEYDGEEYDEGEYAEEDEDDEEDDRAGAPSTSRAQVPAGPLVYREEDYVDVGIITTPHGIRGEVKVRSLTFDPEERFCTRGNRLFLMPSTSFGGPEGTPLRQVTVQNGRMMIAKAAECWVVKFKEVPTRNEAELLRRWRVLMLEADRPSLDGTGEYYVTDLMGLQVFLQDGTEVGTVVDLLEGTGTYDTLRVQLRPQEGQEPSSRPSTVLVPFVEAFCPGVDLAARRMVINPPEGLLELASAPKERNKPTRRGGKGRQRNRQSQEQVPAS